MTDEHCHCGRPLHYTDPKVEQVVREFVAELGRYLVVHCDGRRWLVDRHYIALHGLKAEDLPHLGFQEVQP